MTIANWLSVTMEKLGDSGVDSPRRDALVLLEDTLGKDRSWVLAHPEYKLTQNELETVNKLLERRVDREPLAYIRGKAWFYGRFFKVNPQVLIPRPESEDFIDTLKELNPKTIIDIGTGSGALAITAKLELPKAKIMATDVDESALEIAKTNAQKYKAEITFLQGSLLEPLNDKDLNNYTVIANLPYVPEKLVTSPEIEQEPKLALFSGAEGLDHYKEFWKQVRELQNKPTFILIEALEIQHDILKDLAATAGYHLLKTETLVQMYCENNQII